MTWKLFLGMVGLIDFSLPVIKGETYGAAVWKIPELYGQLNSPRLEQVVSLDAHSCKIKW